MSEEIHAFVDDDLDVKDIEAPFFKSGETVRIRKFAYADRQMLSGSYMKISAKVGGKRGGKRGKKTKDADAKVRADFLLDKMNLAIMDKGIVSWTLYNRQGKEVPFNRKAVRKLTDAYAEFILEEINDFNPRPDEDDEDGEDDNFFQAVDSGGEGDG